MSGAYIETIDNFKSEFLTACVQAGQIYNSMRKVVRTIATVALMFVVATGIAKEPKLSLTPNAEKSLNFEMDVKSEQTLVQITDMNGAIIYSENIKETLEYSKKFNFESLDNGNYSLKVEDDLKETIFTFSVHEYEIIIVDRKENAKPIFRKSGEKVFLNLLNLEKEAVKITVYDSENRVVYTQTITDTILVEKAFNFEGAFKDTYLVVVKNGKDIFYEDVVVE